jgi:soluble lytic murein transglycosylase-like protein
MSKLRLFLECLRGVSLSTAQRWFVIGAATASTLFPLDAGRAEADALWAYLGFSHSGRAACVSMSTVPTARPFAAAIDWAAYQFDVRPSFLLAVVACESNFNALALSKAGARGLAQVMPATARHLGVDPDLLWDPRLNLYSAAKYIRLLVDRYGNDLDKVLIAYNAGPAYVEKKKTIPKETTVYLTRVKGAYRRFLALEAITL